MNVFLMHPSRKFNAKEPLPEHAIDLASDLEIDVLLNAMATDDVQAEVAKRALLLACNNDMPSVQHRQAVMVDCLANVDVIRSMYEIAGAAVEDKRKSHWGFMGRHPASVLHGSVEVLGKFVNRLRDLRGLAEKHSPGFQSTAFKDLFSQIKSELGEDYLQEVEKQLTYVKFKDGVLVSAELGAGNRGVGFTLRRSIQSPPSIVGRILKRGPESYSFRLHPRDEAGARYLGDLRSQGINLVANAMGQSSDHILGFFETLRTELAFYTAALNLSDRLTAIGVNTAMPRPLEMGRPEFTCLNLSDVSLALTANSPVVSNSLETDCLRLMVITGANQGGKTSFTRALGLAYTMMQAGIFVGGDGFTAPLNTGLFTHFKRQEDPTMVGGKLDEELSRLSRMVNTMRPGAMVLLNESFASTNELEGSELADQVVSALLEREIRVIYVTHLYAFASRWYASAQQGSLFLRAERGHDGSRTYRMARGKPLETSYGSDLYHQVFEAIEGDRVYPVSI